MPEEIKRSAVNKVAYQLWARAAGRCEFNGCNRALYKSPITEEQGNISEIAHIWSFSEKGSRGWGPFATKKRLLNKLSNLMLVCHDCHKIIDADKKGERYSAKLLGQWKDEHERRIAIVAGVHPSKKSHVVLFGENIGDEKSLVQPEHAKEALFPRRYPADERPVCLSMSWEGKDDQPEYWVTESGNLDAAFNKQIRPLIKEGNPGHFSVFAFAPMPLMMKLGMLFTEKIDIDVYQLHREPHQTWHWLQGPNPTDFITRRPVGTKNPPVLVISLSDSIAHDRVWSVVGKDISLWELTIDRPHNDFLKSIDQLSQYRETMRGLLATIGQAHGFSTPLTIFPAMPVACAVEMGRVRTPKACMPWVVYDQNSKRNGFVKALEIGGDYE
ncbi:MAG: SAVED domain-containing protein [Planctomycetota bacterium]